MVDMKKKLSIFLDLDLQETEKVTWLSLCFFCIFGASTILVEIKNSLFIALAGIESLYVVKIMSVLVLIPATLIYIRLVDVMDKYKLLTLYTTLYGVVSLLVSILLNNQYIGLLGVKGTMLRTALGWFIHLFYEGATPFVIGLFWTFVNSIMSPDSAKKSYAVMVGVARVGGMVATGIAWYLFKFSCSSHWCSDIYVYQWLLGIVFLMLCSVPFIIHILKRSVADKHLHGYEAAYQIDIKNERQKKNTPMLPGFKKMVANFYVLGIFGLLFCYELFHVIFEMQRLIILDKNSHSLAEMNQWLFQQRFLIHIIALLVSLFAARPLMKRFGEQACLLVMPIVSMFLFVYFIFNYSDFSVMFVYMALVILHHSFAKSLVESLYIPTVRNIRFKSKALIDSFGIKFSIGCGAFLGGALNNFAAIGTPFFFIAHSLTYGIISFAWLILAWFLGKHYSWLVKNNKVVGADD
jgi:AAA family ATP:ADP antiporter